MDSIYQRVVIVTVVSAEWDEHASDPYVVDINRILHASIRMF